MNKSSTKNTLIHISKIPKETKAITHTPLLVEIRCGSLSFVFNEGYRQESDDGEVVSFNEFQGA